MLTSTKMMPTPVSGGYSPNAVKFDGSNDSLTITSLSSISDSKSGILSCWLRVDGGDSTIRMPFAGYYFLIRLDATANTISVRGYNSSGTIILNIETSAKTLASAKWYHLLASWDLASTTTHLYLNDVSDKVAITVTNDTIDYAATTATWAVGANYNGTGQRFNGALAELYFAPGQYLDFSVESNRRKFIDASGLPVSLGSNGSTPTGSQPAIYLKGDYSSFGTNSGSGGNFTVNGALEKASSTPTTTAVNAVDFDGSADYLSKASDLTGVVDGKTFLFSGWFRLDANNSAQIVASNAANYKVEIDFNSVGAFDVYAKNAAGTQILRYQAGNNPITANTNWHHILFACDLAAGTRQCYINNVSITPDVSSYTNDTIDFTDGSWGVCASTAGLYKVNGAISELYFAPNQYLDLSVQANREKFIKDGKPVSLGSDGSLPTGTAPAIYLPNRAALVGTNAGTGGNFTINGAPKDANSTPLYYYAEPVRFDGTNDYLTRGGDLTGIADGKTGTFSCWFRLDGGDATLQRIFANLAGTLRFHVSRNAANKFAISGINAAGSTILDLTSNTAYTASAIWIHLLASWDLATTTGYLYVSNTSDLASGATLTNDTIDYVTATPNWAVGADTDGTDKMLSSIADLWFATTYLDISQASNRAKFIDQTTLRPVPLGAKGEIPTGSQPLLYLGRDFSNFQTNLGSGGNFTVTGALQRATTSPSDVRS